jgi:hypothetical protein
MGARSDAHWKGRLAWRPFFRCDDSGLAAGDAAEAACHSSQPGFNGLNWSQRTEIGRLIFPGLMGIALSRIGATTAFAVVKATCRGRRASSGDWMPTSS